MPAAPEPAPAIRARHLAAFEGGFDLGDGRVELLARAQRLRLQRGPGTDLAHARARGEVGIGLLCTDQLHAAFDAHLNAGLAQAAPQEQQRGLRMGLQVAALGAVQMGVEHEPARIEGLEQHGACARPAVDAGGGHGHCAGFELGAGVRLGVQRGKGGKGFCIQIGHDGARAARLVPIVGASRLLRLCAAADSGLPAARAAADPGKARRARVSRRLRTTDACRQALATRCAPPIHRQPWLRLISTHRGVEAAARSRRAPAEMVSVHADRPDARA